MDELLAWADDPLATAEVAAIAQLDPAEARVALAAWRGRIPAGADFYWS